MAAAPRRPIEVIAFPPGDPRDNYVLEPVGRWMVPTADFLVTGGRYTHLWLPVYAWLRAPVHACRSRPAVSVPTALHYCQCVPLAHTAASAPTLGAVTRSGMLVGLTLKNRAGGGLSRGVQVGP